MLASAGITAPRCAEHWRGNVAALAAAGYEVFAPTLPGYGRAEKPALPYGQVGLRVHRDQEAMASGALGP